MDREAIIEAGVVRDDGRSATRHARRRREGYDALLHDWLPRPDIDMVVTWAASRAQRTLDEYAELRRLFVTHDTLWAYSGQVYDLTKRDDRFRTGLDALRAEDEIEGAREALLRAMRKNAQDGKPHGRLAYGYRLVINPKTGAVEGREPDPVEAAIVQEIARRFLAGESVTALCRELNERGVPSPHSEAKLARDGVSTKGWGATTIRQLLTNPTMIAKRVERGEIVRDGKWDAILDDETFARCEAKYADPARRRTRERTETRLLSGIAKCGVCGGPMTYARNGGYGGKQVRHTYICREGFHVSRGQEPLEMYVVAVVLERFSRPDALAELFEGADDADMSDALDEIDRMQRQLDDALVAFKAGKLSATMLGRIEAEIMPEIDAIRRRARASSLPSIVYDLAEAEDVAALWDSYSAAQRREVLRSLFTIVVQPAGRGRWRTIDPTKVTIEPKR